MRPGFEIEDDSQQEDHGVVETNMPDLRFNNDYVFV